MLDPMNRINACQLVGILLANPLAATAEANWADFSGPAGNRLGSLMVHTSNRLTRVSGAR